MRPTSGVIAVTAAGMAFTIILVAGCGKPKQLGQPIPSDVPAVKLAEIMKNPGTYKDKEVMLDVNYGSYCCHADFSCKEGLEGAEVVPVGFPTPKAKPGAPVRVYGVVRVGERHHEEGEEHEEGEKKEAEEHHEYYIEAKGVQFK